MTLVQCIYSFTYEISDAERGVFRTVRAKLVRHPYESLYDVYARSIAFCHAYEEGQEFGPGRFERHAPDIVQRDSIGETRRQIFVGLPEAKTIERAHRTHGAAAVRIYVWRTEERAAVGRLLRELKPKLAHAIELFALEEAVFETLVSQESTSPRWSYTTSDGTIYLSADALDVETRVDILDGPALMWTAAEEARAAAREHTTEARPRSTEDGTQVTPASGEDTRHRSRARSRA